MFELIELWALYLHKRTKIIPIAKYWHCQSCSLKSWTGRETLRTCRFYQAWQLLSRQRGSNPQTISEACFCCSMCLKRFLGSCIF